MFTVSLPRSYTHEYTLLVFDAVTRHGNSPSPVSPLYRSVALEYFQRLVKYVTKLDRTVCSRFSIADRVFNMLEIQADYSLTAQSVYRRVATRLIERIRKLNILSCVTHSAAIEITYPSWVPRWDMPTGGVEILTAFPNQEYRASSNIEHALYVSSDYADHLMVDGVCLSSISLLSDVIS